MKKKGNEFKYIKYVHDSIVILNTFKRSNYNLLWKTLFNFLNINNEGNTGK